MGVCFHSGCPFLRAFELKRYIKRDVKMPSLHWGPVGETGGDSLAGTF